MAASGRGDTCRVRRGGNCEVRGSREGNIEGLHSVGHEVGHSGLAEWCTAEAVCGAS